MGGEKKPMGMSELGCADDCGLWGAREWLEMGREKPLGMNELGCANGCGRRGCKGVGGEKKPPGWGEEDAGDERAWLRGWLRTAWVKGGGWKAGGDERAWLRGRLRTAWLQGSGWKWVGKRSRWRSASFAARTAADGMGQGSEWK